MQCYRGNTQGKCMPFRWRQYYPYIKDGKRAMQYGDSTKAQQPQARKSYVIGKIFKAAEYKAEEHRQ